MLYLASVVGIMIPTIYALMLNIVQWMGMFDECFNDGFQNRFEYSEFESPLKSFVKNINELERLLNKFKISLYENEDSEDIRKKILLMWKHPYFTRK